MPPEKESGEHSSGKSGLSLEEFKELTDKLAGGKRVGSDWTEQGDKPQGADMPEGQDVSVNQPEVGTEMNVKVLGERISSLDTKLDQTERRLSDNIESSERRLGLRIDGVEDDVENVDNRVGNLKWYIMASVALATLLLALMNYGVI